MTLRNLLVGDPVLVHGTTIAVQPARVEEIGRRIVHVRLLAGRRYSFDRDTGLDALGTRARRLYRARQQDEDEIRARWQLLVDLHERGVNVAVGTPYDAATLQAVLDLLTPHDNEESPDGS